MSGSDPAGRASPDDGGKAGARALAGGRDEARAVLDAIRSRRSVRRFADEPVPDEVVREIVDCARAAPAGGGRRLVKFLAVRKRGTLALAREAVEKKIALLRSRVTSPKALEQFDGYAAHFTHFWKAPVVVAVLARSYDSVYTRIIEKYIPEEERPSQDLVEVASMTAAAAVENMLVAACALGYGACFMTGPTIAQEELERLLSVESPWHLVAMVPIGRPEGPPGPSERPPLTEVLAFD